MVEVKTYYLPPTDLIPNSPRPLLYYPGLLQSLQSSVEPGSTSIKSNLDTKTSVGESETTTITTIRPEKVYDVFSKNAWQPQWIFRYGHNQQSHYHSKAHECMAVLSGSATIRFGVADINIIDHSSSGDATVYAPDGTSPDGKPTEDKEKGGVEVAAKVGDVFVIPAGIAHKTFNTIPEAELTLLTPGDGHGIDAAKFGGDERKALEEIRLSGFTMLGAYPAPMSRGEDGKEGETGNNEWDFATGGENRGEYEKVWNVTKPIRDPVLGLAQEGVCGLW